ncbi:Metallo-dependent phosphatase-like protein [Triangularia verruculosa]|uniref:Metallo-dependent phosphatase-like protein n=1 Tax=Triangularia verruculosa TaxID=2587418 RepID=A0AAN7AWP0_9PEZI|nr:Metallo-dependent phosphatase-like protein [Triangularia verruculosa]
MSHLISKLFDSLLGLLYGLLSLLYSALVLLGITRPNEWEPPTLLDSLLFSPLLYLTTKLYHTFLFLRGHPFHPPPHHSRIRVVCLSDTHSLRPSHIPQGDLLIHAGDISATGTFDDLQDQINWLSSLPGFKHKVVIAGNHDCFLDPDSSIHRSGPKEKRILNWKGLTYLQDELVTLEFDDREGGGKRKLNIYGSPWIPRCGGNDFAFQYLREKAPWEGKIPVETDVLVTHCPPKGHRDLHLGCPSLLSELWRVKPKVHVFGHVHHGAGVESLFFDECQAAYESLLLRTTAAEGNVWKRWWDVKGLGDALNVLRYGLQSVLWKWIMTGPGSNNGGVLVNAGVMKGNTGRLRKGRGVVRVVDL